MYYNDFKNKLIRLTRFRNKNYSITDPEIEDVIDIVYTELMSDTHMTFVAELVYPDCPMDNEISCCESIEYGIDNVDSRQYPPEYTSAQKIEVYQITCVDGFIVDRMLDKIHRTRYALNFNALLNTGHCRNDPMDTPLVFHWKCIPEIGTLEDWIYDTIYQPMLEGINYYIQSNIPAQVDNAISNWSYKRWFNSREKLINQFPQFPEVGRVKWIDAPICGDTCNEIGMNCLNFITVDHKAFHVCEGDLVVSVIHGSCTEEIHPLPIYGLMCPDMICPDCAELMVRVCSEDGFFQEFITKDGGSFRTSTTSCSCGYCPEPVEPEFGYTCTPDVDCPDCIILKSYDFMNKTFDTFVPKDNDRFTIGWKHNGCGNGYEEGPEYGLDCTPMVDCPDCVYIKVFAGYDYHGNKVFDQLVSYRSRFLGSSVHGSCASSAIAPTAPINIFATNDQSGRVLIQWDRPIYGSPAPVYDVERDGTIVVSDLVSTMYQDEVSAGTYTYRILAKNSSGSMWSHSVTGTSLDVSNEPNGPTNFVASSDREGQILITFNNSTSGIPAPTYDLYDSSEVRVATNIISGYIWTTEPGEYTMFVRAVNSSGFADSNMSAGKSLTIHEAFYTVNAKLFIVVPGDTLKVEV